MPANQIVPFATGAGAEVVDPVTYAAEGYIQQGFQAGILQPYDLNTVLRQSSFVAAMVAQFIADHQANAVNDDGNVTKLENQFLAALLSAVEGESIVYVVDGGTADALSGTPSSALSAYTAGQVIAVRKNASVGTNATATPTINLNGLGAVTIVKSNGGPLYAGDLSQGSIFVCVYDGTYFRHIGLTLSTAALNVQAGQAVAFASSGTNAYTGTLVPAPTALTPRMEVLGFFATANTGAAAPTLLLNGIGSALPILKQGGGVPSAGDVSGIVPLVLNTAGTAWLINGLAPSDTKQIVLNVQRTQIVADRGTQTQSVPTGVTTTVTNYGNATVQSQSGSTFSNGVLTVGASDAGLWFVSFHARQSITGTSGFTNGLYINGSATPVITGGANGTSSGAATIHGTGARLLNLNAGDQVTVGLIQTTGSTVTFNDLYDFSAVRLGSS